jgi:hypothetical protein
VNDFAFSVKNSSEYRSICTEDREKAYQQFNQSTTIPCKMNRFRKDQAAQSTLAINKPVPSKLAICGATTMRSSHLNGHLPCHVAEIKEIPSSSSHYTNIRRRSIHLNEEWRIETHGGVKMWVNNKTNEVSVANPLANEIKKKPFGVQRDFTFRVKQGPIPHGTASHMYDSSAVKEMFQMLGEPVNKKSGYYRV